MVYMKNGKARFKPGEIIFPWRGKGMFGHGSGQITVHSLGAAHDRIRLTFNDTGEQRVLDRYEYERMKEEVKKGYFNEQETFWKATYRYTTEGKIAADRNLIQGFTKAIHTRYQHASVKDLPLEDRQYMIELFQQMSIEDRKKFMDQDYDLFSQIIDYENEISMDDDYFQGTSESRYIMSKLESYLKPEQIRRARNLARMRV